MEQKKRFLYKEGASSEEMYDANEREMSKEPQNFKDLEKSQDTKQTSENVENSVIDVKCVNIFGAICLGLSILCLAAAVGAMVYFLRI